MTFERAYNQIDNCRIYDTKSSALYNGISEVNTKDYDTKVECKNRIDDLWDTFNKYIIKGVLNYMKISNIKLYPNEMNPVAMECVIEGYRNNKIETEKIKTKVSKGDEFSLTKGLYIALAKFFDSKKEYTPEGIEYQAQLLSYQREYHNLVEKAAKKFYKDYAKKLEDKREAEKESERKKIKKQKAIAKKQERLKKHKYEQREEQIGIMVEAIKRAKNS